MLKAGGVCRNYEHRSRKVFIEQKMYNAILGLDSGLIQAQLKLADAIRKLAEHAERNGIELDMDVQVQSLLHILGIMFLDNAQSQIFTCPTA